MHPWYWGFAKTCIFVNVSVVLKKSQRGKDAVDLPASRVGWALDEVGHPALCVVAAGSAAAGNWVGWSTSLPLSSLSAMRRGVESSTLPAVRKVDWAGVAKCRAPGGPRDDPKNHIALPRRPFRVLYVLSTSTTSAFVFACLFTTLRPHSPTMNAQCLGQSISRKTPERQGANAQVEGGLGEGAYGRRR